jgi:hypothetical protein
MAIAYLTLTVTYKNQYTSAVIYTDCITQIIAAMQHTNPTIKISFLTYIADVQEPVNHDLELKQH